MIVAYVPAGFAIASALVYALSSNAKVQALALYAFAGAWLACMLAAHGTWRIG